MTTSAQIGPISGVRRKPRQVRRRIAATLRYTTLVLAALAVLVPLVTMCVAALNHNPEGPVNPFSAPRTLYFENFAKAWRIGKFGGYLGNTVIYCAIIVGGVVSLATAAGYALARLRLPGGNLIFGLFLVGIMVPFQAVMMPLYFLARSLHLLNSYWALAVPGIAFGLGFGIFVMRAFFRDLPYEITEAARIDGAGEWRIFLQVMLPMARAGVLTLVVFQLLYTWSAYLMPLVLVQSQNLRPVSLGMIFFQGTFISDESLLAAGAAIVSLPMIVSYVFLQRYFIRGIVAGALK